MAQSMKNTLQNHSLTSNNFESQRKELASVLARFTSSDGPHQTAIPFLTLYRWNAPTATACGVYEPSLTLVAQGSKRALLGGETYVYDQTHFLVTSVDLPVMSQVTGATKDTPYLCLCFRIDLRRLSELMTEAESAERETIPEGRGIFVGQLSAPLLDAALRLMHLLETPQDIPVLAPLIEREILYRLLQSDQGMRLRHIARRESQSHQIAKAIDWLKANYAKPLRIEELARRVSMSPSSLHHHFKAITAMSPLQYQKQFRLQEARRLMLTEMLDAASAGHQVGYESPSHFSREYCRLYGAPPVRDIVRLQNGEQTKGEFEQL
jgi:AraC-like DNA-binding protein